jgi:uncharacterized delta-60 repeat protein
VTTPDFALVRYNANGTLDTTFATGGILLLDAAAQYGQVSDMRVLANGKILLAGSIQTNSTTYSDFGLVQLNADGTYDTSFGVNGKFTIDLGAGMGETVNGMAIQPDGKIVVVGNNGGGNQFMGWRAIRVNAGGTLDTGFGTNGIATFPDAIGFYETAYDVSIQPDGKIVVAGQAGRTTSNSPLVYDAVVARLNANGSVDTTFGTTASGYTKLTVAGGTQAYSNVGVELLADGRIVVGATGTRVGVALLSSAGAVLASDFSASPDLRFEAMTLGPGGTVDVIGWSTQYAGSGTRNRWQIQDIDQKTVTVTDDEPPPPSVSISLSPTSVLEHFGPNATTATLTRANGDLTQPLTVYLTSSDTTEATVPYSATFPANQTTVTVPIASADDTAQDGTQTSRIAVTGPPTSTITGSIAGNGYFGNSMTSAAAVLVDSSFRSYFVGNSGGDVTVRRYTTAYAADATFGSGGVVVADLGFGTETVEAAALDANGRIVVVGRLPSGGTNDIFVARFTAAGALDATFGTGGKIALDLGTGAYNEAWGVAIQGDGNILVAGNITNPTTSIDYAVLRLTDAGHLDSSFGTNGVTTIDWGGLGDRAFAIALQADGKIVVAGETAGGNSVGTMGIVRLTTAGGLDATFGSGGKVSVNTAGTYESATDIEVRPNGAIVVGGRIGRSGSSPLTYDPAIVQLTSSGSLDSSFGTGGISLVNNFNGTTIYSPVRFALQPDNRLVLISSSDSSTVIGRIVRLSPTGAIEHSTNMQYSTSVPEDIAILSSNGDIYVPYQYSGPAAWMDRYRTTPTSSATEYSARTLTVLDNEPFAAAADNYTIDEDTTLTVPAATGLLANDTISAPINPQTVVVENVQNGTLTLNTDGSFTFVPSPNAFGTARFFYRIVDGIGSSGSAAVTITINPTPDAPIASNDTYSVNEDGALVANVYAPASPTPSQHFTFDEAESGTAPAADVGLAPVTNGAFVGSATRTQVQRMSQSGAAMSLDGTAGYFDAGTGDDLTNGFVMSFWVHLRELPNPGDVLVGDFWATPGASAPPAGTTGWNLEFVGLSGGNYALWLNRRTSNGTVVTPNGSQTQALNMADWLNKWMFVAVQVRPAVSFAGTTMTLSLGNTTTAISTWANASLVNVVNPLFSNSAPLGFGGSVLTSGIDGNYTLNASYDDIRIFGGGSTWPATPAAIDAIRITGSRNFGVLANDADPDGASIFSAQLVSGPANGTVALAADGSFRYVPNPNFAGNDSFTYRAVDAGGLASNVATATITVLPTPDVETVSVNMGANQRSRVTNIAVSFDADVTIASGAFTLTRLSDGAAISSGGTDSQIAVTTQLVNGKTVATLTFVVLSGSPLVQAGSLADGVWQLRIEKTKVTIAGREMAADYVTPTTGTAATGRIHRLFGDGNGDGSVNGTDFSTFRFTFGSSIGMANYRADMDFNSDGSVNGTDWTQFRSRFGSTLP